MSRTLAITFAIGLAVMAAVVGGVLVVQHGAHIELIGKILKVRTAPLDENSSVVVIDYRVQNPADYTFMAQAVTVILEDAKGVRTEGKTASERDATQLFLNVPLLGEKFNSSLKIRDQVPARSTADHMTAARFEVPETQLQTRKRFLIKIEDVDGPVAEFSEK